VAKEKARGAKKILTYETTVIKIPFPLKELFKSIIDYELNFLNQKRRV